MLKLGLCFKTIFTCTYK